MFHLTNKINKYKQMKSLILITLLSLISCFSIRVNEENDNKTNSSISNELKGKWNIVQMNQEKGKIGTFEFSQNSISVNVGCNGIGSSYEIKPKQKIKFEQAMSTMRYCDEKSNRKEQIIGLLIPKLIRYQFIKDNVLKLETEDTKEFLILEK